MQCTTNLAPRSALSTIASLLTFAMCRYSIFVTFVVLGMWMEFIIAEPLSIHSESFLTSTAIVYV